MASNQLEAGDLIKISRFGYQHWALYIGNDEVVHIVKPGTGRAIVKREKLMNEVGNHHGYSVHNYLDNKYKPRDPGEIIKEALSHVGEELPYNLLTQNCEHFATDMRYGKPECRQVLQYGIIGASVLFLMTAGLSALHLSRKQKAASRRAEKRLIRPPKIVVDERPGQCPCDEELNRFQSRSQKCSIAYPEIVDYEPSKAANAEDEDILYVDEQYKENAAQYYTK